MPRPKNECMKLAYLWMITFCSSVGVRISRPIVATPNLYRGRYVSVDTRGFVDGDLQDHVYANND